MNIKSFVRNVLLDADIINLTADKTVYFLHATSANFPYVEYEIIDEYGHAWAENGEIATSYEVQVDIFSKGDYTELENKIKGKMINAGFVRTTSADLYESDGAVYHKAMRFLIQRRNN